MPYCRSGNDHAAFCTLCLCTDLEAWLAERSQELAEFCKHAGCVSPKSPIRRCRLRQRRANLEPEVAKWARYQADFGAFNARKTSFLRVQLRATREELAAAQAEVCGAFDKLELLGAALPHRTGVFPSCRLRSRLLI